MRARRAKAFALEQPRRHGLGGYGFGILAAVVAQALDFAEVIRAPWGALLALVLLASLARRSLCGHPLWWATVTVIGGAVLVSRPLFLPNHHYLMTYLALALTLTGLDRRPLHAPIEVSEGARTILAAVMACAVTQKLLSPTYVDFVGYVMATGGFAEPVLMQLDTVASAVGRNSAEAAQFFAQAPDPVAAIALRIPAGFGFMAAAWAGFIVVIEAYLAIMALVRPASPLFHLPFVTFLAVLGVIRRELIFASALCALGLLMTSHRPTRWHRAYLVVFAVVAAAAAWRLAFT